MATSRFDGSSTAILPRILQFELDTNEVDLILERLNLFRHRDGLMRIGNTIPEKGIEAGDIIFEINGRMIPINWTENDFQTTTQQYSRQGLVRIKTWRITQTSTNPNFNSLNIIFPEGAIEVTLGINEAEQFFILTASSQVLSQGVQCGDILVGINFRRIGSYGLTNEIHARLAEKQNLILHLIRFTSEGIPNENNNIGESNKVDNQMSGNKNKKDSHDPQSGGFKIKKKATIVKKSKPKDLTIEPNVPYLATPRQVYSPTFFAHSSGNTHPSGEMFSEFYSHYGFHSKSHLLKDNQDIPLTRHIEKEMSFVMPILPEVGIERKGYIIFDEDENRKSHLELFQK